MMLYLKCYIVPEDIVTMIPAKLLYPIKNDYNTLILDKLSGNLLCKYIQQEFMIVDSELNHVLLRNIICSSMTSYNDGKFRNEITFLTNYLRKDWYNYLEDQNYHLNTYGDD